MQEMIRLSNKRKLMIDGALNDLAVKESHNINFERVFIRRDKLTYLEKMDLILSYYSSNLLFNNYLNYLLSNARALCASKENEWVFFMVFSTDYLLFSSATWQ